LRIIYDNVEDTLKYEPKQSFAQNGLKACNVPGPRD